MSNEKKWTPGPWEWSNSELDTNDLTVSRRLEWESEERDKSQTILLHNARWDVTKANRNLIAAAPELYEALEDAATALEIVQYKMKMSETKLVKHLYAVLAKARGEA